MSRLYLEASTRSICFSKAIRHELAQQIEDAVPVRIATSYHDTSDTISEAILWELEWTFNSGAQREVDSDDKCKRFALTLSEDDMTDDEEILLPAATCALEKRDSTLKSRTPKKAQRSLHHKKRPYTWKQPLKNKGGVIRKRLLEAKLANAKAKASVEHVTIKPKKINSHSEYSIDLLEDDFNVDQLFHETDEEKMIMMDGDTSSEDEAGMVEDGDDLFVPKLNHVRATPPPTTRQLVSLIRKKMGELYDLAAVTPGEAVSVPGLNLAERIRGAVDKVKFDQVGDLSAADIVTLHEALSLLEENQLAMDF